MLPFTTHFLFDLLAVASAIAGGGLVYRWRLRQSLARTAASVTPVYFLFLAAGSLMGAYGLGTANLWLSGIPGIGRSILGALMGATLMVELYKLRRGVTRSTGYIYVVPFCLAVAVGRLGCLFSGLDDQTYGIPTGAGWGWDFGDGIPRHPVALYESLAMAGFAVAFAGLLQFRPAVAISIGFYLCAGFYGAQRFVWEFLKPYGTLIGPFNLFHLACLVLVLYSVFMILRRADDSI